MPTARLKLLAPLAALLLAAAPACAQYNQPELGSMDRVVLPYKTGEVGVDEKLGNSIAPQTPFIDEDGNHVEIGSFLHKNRPVILWLGYYECPMLCDKMSAGMVDAVKGIQLDAGREFAIVNVSIDPNESAGLAKAKKATYLKELGQPGNAAAWNLLTGSPESVATLAASVGYKFKKVEIKGETQFAHPAVLILLSPEGRVTRYLYPDGAKPGVAFDEKTMRLSLIEASDGTIGTTIDRVLLTCLHYDSTTGKYTKDAIAIMRVAGALTVIVMGAIFIPLWIRAARAKKSDEPPARGSPAVGV